MSWICDLFLFYQLIISNRFRNSVQKMIMFWQLLGLENIDDLIIINDHVSFKSIKIDVTLFWLLYLAVFTIEKFENRTIC